jgi:hypothetical protein
MLDWRKFMRGFEKLKENKLARMREGQAAGEIVTLVSDPEVRFVVVPLTDGEYLKALSISDEVQASETMSGFAVKDEVLKQAILLFAAREIHDWTKSFFESVEEVMELEAQDVNVAYDVFLELISVASPSMQMLTEEEMDNLKKVWSLIAWSELSGRQLYAARRFLNSIQEDLLLGNFSGLSSTPKSTTTNNEQDSVPSVV